MKNIYRVLTKPFSLRGRPILKHNGVNSACEAIQSYWHGSPRFARDDRLVVFMQKHSFTIITAFHLLFAQVASAAELIALPSAKGSSLFLRSYQPKSFWPVALQLVTQDHRAYCSIASSVTVLNALAVPAPTETAIKPWHTFTQHNFFTTAVQKVLPSQRVSRHGATLDEISRALKTFPVTVHTWHAGDTSAAEFRALAADSLQQAHTAVIVNYLRTSLKQTGAGHMSPLAAYDKISDRFLIMDVARFRYPPVWVKTADLWQAMHTIDPQSHTYRGFIIVTNHPRGNMHAIYTRSSKKNRHFETTDLTDGWKKIRYEPEQGNAFGVKLDLIEYVNPEQNNFSLSLGFDRGKSIIYFMAHRLKNFERDGLIDHLRKGKLIWSYTSEGVCSLNPDSDIFFMKKPPADHYASNVEISADASNNQKALSLDIGIISKFALFPDEMVSDILREMKQASSNYNRRFLYPIVAFFKSHHEEEQKEIVGREKTRNSSLSS